jgi:signal transduction histidine kinase
VLDQIDSTMKSMRSIINNLRPVVLDLGLNAAIEWQVKEFQRRTGIDCGLIMPEQELVLDDNRATALFRILQESLNNVLRHAQATKAEIRLNLDGDRLCMKVIDNGIGIFPGCRRKANSFGLVGIKERISTLGGELIIDTGPNKGTSLTVALPVTGDGQEPEKIEGGTGAYSVGDMARLAQAVPEIGISGRAAATERKKRESRSTKIRSIAKI